VYHSVLGGVTDGDRIIRPIGSLIGASNEKFLDIVELLELTQCHLPRTPLARKITSLDLILRLPRLNLIIQFNLASKVTLRCEGRSNTLDIVDNHGGVPFGYVFILSTGTDKQLARDWQ